MDIRIKPLILKRLERLKAQMSEKGIGAAVLVKPENVFYFSHFNPVINSHPVFMLVPSQGEPCLLVHCLRYAHAQEESCIDSIRCYGRWGDAPSLAQEPADAIGRLLGASVDTVGFELESIPAALCTQLCEKLRIRSSVSLSEEISVMKMVKDAYEIDCIRRSARLVDCGVQTAIEYLRKGRSEAEACTEAQYRMRKMWHKSFPEYEVCGFGTSEGGMIDSLHVWCLSNEHIAYGCDCPRHYIPVGGDVSLPMAWAKLGGYHAENERTVISGKLSGPRERAYSAMLEARAGIFQILKPGVRFEELYSAAANVFSAHGFGDILPGRVGHGVGNSAHEFPSLARGNRIALAPGMVVTVEPGLMDKGWGGVRHSDTVLITGSGYEVLTKLDSGLLRL